MIWLCVFPTLTVLNVMFGDWLASMPAVVRTFVQETIAVPIVIYGLMPHLGGRTSCASKGRSSRPSSNLGPRPGAWSVAGWRDLDSGPRA
jgi:hypothetical protein